MSGLKRVARTVAHLRGWHFKGEDRKETEAVARKRATYCPTVARTSRASEASWIANRTTEENNVQVHCRKEVLSAARDMFSSGNTEVDGCALWEPQSQRAKLSLGKSCHPGALTHRNRIIPCSNTSKEKAVLDSWASGWGRSLLGANVEEEME